jgi:hypothetical protein
VCRAAPFADNDAGIPQMVALIRALSARLAEVEAERNQYAEGYAQTLGRKWNADDAMIRAALEVAANGVEKLGSRLGYVDAGVTGPVTTSKAISRAIRAIKDDAKAIAAIKAKAGDRG